jgi:Short C-terminal domain
MGGLAKAFWTIFPGLCTGGGPPSSAADELARLADLKASGAITEEEFPAGKAKVLA